MMVMHRVMRLSANECHGNGLDRCIEAISSTPPPIGAFRR